MYRQSLAVSGKKKQRTEKVGTDPSSQRHRELEGPVFW